MMLLMIRIWIPVLLLFLALSGCAAEEIKLAVRGSKAPAGVDLTGVWIVKEKDADNSRSADMLVEVFLELGETLKITQTDFGLFISFDRAVVEEYRFGEQREVSVGPISADRSSGWDGRSYVIETLDKEGARLLERYRLDAKGEALLRPIELWRGERQLGERQQVFARE